MISLSKLQTRIIFYLISQGESNMIPSDNIAVRFHHHGVLPHHISSRQGQTVVVDIGKTNGIHTETGLTPMQVMLIVGTNIGTLVVVNRIIRTTFTKNSGTETEGDIKEEQTIEVAAQWVAGLKISNRSWNKC